LEIRREDLLDLIEKRPQMGIKILKRIAQLLASRLRQSSQDVIRLTTALSIALSG
jgi:CRP-like cAMP-binding protein